MGTKFNLYGVRGEVSFGLDDAEGEDGSYVFCGYWTGAHTADIWGFAVNFSATVEPEGYGERINVLEECSGGGGASWFENRLDLMREVELTARNLQGEVARRYPEMSVEFAMELEGYYDAGGLERLVGALADVMGHPSLAPGRRAEALIPIFEGLDRIVREARIPERMKLGGSPFNVILLETASRLRSVRLRAEEEAAGEGAVPEKFFTALGRALDTLESASAEHEEGSRRAEEALPKPSEDEAAGIEAMEAELESPDTADGRRIEIWRELYGNELVSLGRRIDFVEAMSNLLTGSGARVNESIRAARERHGVMPPMDGYVDEINRTLAELDGFGFARFADALADEFLEAANAWRQKSARPPLTREEFLDALCPATVCASVIDRAGEPRGRVEIYVRGKCDDALAGRVLYIKLICGDIAGLDVIPAW
ncbi:MAG: hypothetical protein LBQ56_03810 [Synergistaceae bacterium]|jgi:hypothetical protein|nr:hypothetical protein [Synergistaceae bacterium]